MKLTFSDVMFWYKLYEFQVTEEEIVHEYLSKSKKVPKNKILRKLVDDRIKKRRQEIGQ